MNDLNHVVLIGHITRDCGANERDFGYTQGGTAKANISIAVNRSRKDATGQYVDEVSYFDVAIWGKTAENLKPYLKKGKQICVDGVLKQDRWQDKQTGKNMSRVSINAVTVQLLGGNKDEAPQGNTIQAQQSAYAKQYQNQMNEGVSDSMYGGDFPDEIPF